MAMKKTGARKATRKTAGRAKRKKPGRRPGGRPRTRPRAGDGGTDGGTPPWGERQPGGGWVQAAGPKKRGRLRKRPRAVKLLARVRPR